MSECLAQVAGSGCRSCQPLEAVMAIPAPMSTITGPAAPAGPGQGCQPTSRRSMSSAVSRRISGQAWPSWTAMTGGLVRWL